MIKAESDKKAKSRARVSDRKATVIVIRGRRV
jgi:hypothetical protein